ncbi:WxL domain-containing protein [Lactiplantibacillus sp. WILCCON 0030]|uniref:WxL domain-containing protein n=1 Tax=Lactiplantibacillus brownii TaxID=3069269 RepID=A0ABU1A5V0_9LACO|nr:WxL domain-containing protein [Lactiplantibacillus brownii]MDQ7936349.1 WxL domain-containing protein [Lactiplantibacillus brownii]
MKKSLGLAAILGVATLLAVPVVGQAAEVQSGDTTTANVTLTQDPDNKVVKLTHAPNIDFGAQPIGTSSLTLHSQTIDDDLVVENPGLGAGWTVNVSATPFTDGSKTLADTKFNLAAGSVTPVESNSSAKPNSMEVTLLTSEQPIFVADRNAGIGAWKTTYASDQASLNIPAGNVAGSYTSTLTWSLTNAPEAPDDYD